MKCPNCDANLKIKPGTKECICEYCDSRFILEDDQLFSYGDSSETPRYSYGNQQSDIKDEGYYRDFGRYDPSRYVPIHHKKRRTWLWVLGWIVCFPIPATILINRKKIGIVLYGSF